MARKILLADDSVTAQNMGRKILADAGYDVTTVNNGSAALKKIAELKPDLVILDVYMPGYSGLEVCQRLRESQDSSRIPVLLSVGKLEPFKPEEANRVRADSYIVKPFEASELLSALSKLEDMIVPRTEPSKPGRFARAVAAAEEVGRGRNEASDDKGWKSRIARPDQKSEAEKTEARKSEAAEEKISDPAASDFFNPINRDLRTVVETPAEIAASKSEPKLQPSEKVAEASLDVAALAPPGLPTDVTAEELAAIAAAAAQIEMLNAAIKEQPPVLQETIPNPTLDQATSDHVQDGQALAALVSADATDLTQSLHSESALQGQTSQTIEVVLAKTEESHSEEAKIETAPSVSSVAAETSEQSSHGAPDSEISSSSRTSISEEPQDVPVTIAAAQPQLAESPDSPKHDSLNQDLTNLIASSTDSANRDSSKQDSSRWVAVSVALQGEEATLSLDDEMRKAFAAFAAKDTGWGDSTDVAALISCSPPKPAAELVPSVTAPAEAMAADTEASAALESAPEISAPAAPPVSIVEEAVVAEAVVAESAAPPTQDVPAAPTPEDANPSSAVSSSANLSSEIVAPVESAAPIATAQAAEISEDESQKLKSTAAAWANWQETHPATDSTPAIPEPQRESQTESQARETEVAAESSVMAAAAGAETAAQETPAQADRSPDIAEIAGIVDSVLADLRPRLMAEISRKMAEKKS